MKFSAIFVASVLGALSTSVLGRPSGLAERVAARAARKGLPRLPADPSFKVDASNTSHVEFSGNWAGAVIESPPSGQTFKTVVGTFNVPKATGGASASSSAWVGIDGDTYGNAILQAGVDFNGDGTYDSWYEWYPNFAFDFTGFSIASGDTITVTIVATTLSAGTVTLKNNRSGASVSKTLSAPSSSSHLGGQNAEWIVEDFESGNSQVPFADFGTVTFTGASATTNTGTVVNLANAIAIEIEQNSQILTTTTIPSTSSVVITHIP